MVTSKQLDATLDYDLIIRAGRVVCHDSQRDSPGAVAIRSGRIVALGKASELRGAAMRTLEFPDSLLLPGLVDLHAHPARSGSKYGVDPDREFLPRGVTTVLSQGDAGAEGWPTYRQETIESSQTRVRLAINLSKYGEPVGGSCFHDRESVDVNACVDAIRQSDELIWGIAVNLSRVSCQIDPSWVMQQALIAAEETGKPLLYGMRNPSDWSIAEQLALLRPGDVVTYLLREDEWSMIDIEGRVRPEYYEARDRGVLFDACHGMQSFSFPVAEAAISQGFYPDTISTDQYAAHLNSEPPHDLPSTMSKFIAAGMPEREVFARVGPRPAEILGLQGEVGSLAKGQCADLTVLRQSTKAALLRDACGNQRRGRLWRTELVVRGGAVVMGR